MAAEKDKNTFGNTMENLFKGMDGFITTKTVVGDAIYLRSEERRVGKECRL